MSAVGPAPARDSYRETMFRTNAIPEEEIYGILANRRRREAIRQLTVASSDGTITLSDLSEAVAERETGESPPPRSIRESVYNSLHQTHLPKLEEFGVVRYDRDARTIHLRNRAREIDRYMEVLSVFGVTWGEVYRTLGVLTLAAVTAALADVPFVRAIDPLLWASGSLAAFAVAITYQLWTNRWYVRHALRS